MQYQPPIAELEKVFLKIDNVHDNMPTSIQALSTSNLFYHLQDYTILEQANAKWANKPKLEVIITACFVASNLLLVSTIPSIRDSAREDFSMIDNVCYTSTIKHNSRLPQAVITCVDLLPDRNDRKLQSGSSKSKKKHKQL